jgi:Protein of unknown function (DUF3179)
MHRSIQLTKPTSSRRIWPVTVNVIALIRHLSRAGRRVVRSWVSPRNGYTSFSKRFPKEQRKRWNDWKKNRAPGERFVPLFHPTFLAAAEATYLQPDENIIGIILNGEAKAYPTQMLAFHHLVPDHVGGEPVLISYCERCNSSVGFRPLVDGMERHFLVHGLRDGAMLITDRETGTVWSHLTGEALEGSDAGRHLDHLQVFQMAWQQWWEMRPGTLVLRPDDAFAWTYFRHPMGEENMDLCPRVPGGEKLAPHGMGLGVQLDGAAMFFSFEKMAGSGIAQAKLGGETTVTVFCDAVSRGCGAYRAAEDMVRSVPGRWHDVRTHSTWNLEGLCTAGARAGERLSFVPSYSLQWYAWAKRHPQTEVWN